LYKSRFRAQAWFHTKCTKDLAKLLVQPFPLWAEQSSRRLEQQQHQKLEQLPQRARVELPAACRTPCKKQNRDQPPRRTKCKQDA